MPTWRETRENFIVSAGFDFVLLNEVLRQRDNLFLLKLHPESNLSMEEMSRYSNILVLDKRLIFIRYFHLRTFSLPITLPFIMIIY